MTSLRCTICRVQLQVVERDWSGDHNMFPMLLIPSHQKVVVQEKRVKVLPTMPVCFASDSAKDIACVDQRPFWFADIELLRSQLSSLVATLNPQ